MARTRACGSGTGEDESPCTSRRGGTKRRHSSNTTRFPLSYFWNKQGQTSYYESGKSQAGIDRAILPGRAIKTGFLRAQKFHDLAALLDFQGWSSFLSKSWEYEPSLIRQFYHNLTPDCYSDDAITYKSKCYGKTVHFSAKALASHFFGSEELVGKCLNEENYTDSDACPTYDHAQAIRSLQEPECTNPVSCKVSDMTLQNRFLFHILTRIIKPRGGSHTEATLADVGLLYFVNNRIRVCLPDLMFRHITRVASRKGSACVYGMALTNFLIAHCGVPSHPSDSNGLPDSKIFYNEGHLGWLYGKDTETGEWIRRFHSKGNTSAAGTSPTHVDHVASSSAQPREVVQEVPTPAPHVPALPTYLDSTADKLAGAIEDCRNKIRATLSHENQAVLTSIERMVQGLTTFSQHMVKVSQHVDKRLKYHEDWFAAINDSLTNLSNEISRMRTRPRR